MMESKKLAIVFSLDATKKNNNKKINKSCGQMRNLLMIIIKMHLLNKMLKLKTQILQFVKLCQVSTVSKNVSV